MNDTGDVAPAAQGKGRGVKIALGISLALNLLIVGVVAGALLRHGDPRARVVRDLDFGPFTEALTPRDREVLRRSFVERAAPEMRDVRREMRGDLEVFLQVLRDEPFDAAALSAVMDNQADRMARRIDLGRTLLLERLAAMTQAERAAFAERLERRLRRGDGNRPAPDETGGE